jgi:drug/metabolite transporter (DMT)-like permease
MAGFFDLSMWSTVGARGFEPPTSRTRTVRAKPDCATPRTPFASLGCHVGSMPRTPRIIIDSRRHCKHNSESAYNRAMLGISLVLLLIAAALHALSNALIKQARDKLAFTWWTGTTLAILGLPVWFFIGRPEPVGWLYITVSGLVEAIYFVTLTRAYALGDLSQVYPMARGSAPLFVLLWATLLLNEHPSGGGVIGILLIVGGLYLVNLPSLADWPRPLLGLRSPASRWALLTGLLISVYSSIDKVGIEYFDPLVYLYLFLLVTWLALSSQWCFPQRRAALRAEIRPPASSRGRWSRAQPPIRVVLGALLGTGAYTLVLMALRLSPVSYVSPVREVSVVVGAWIGVRFMGEKGGALRIGASILIAGGILLIALAG